MSEKNNDQVAIAANIVVAYVANNTIPAAALPAFINDTFVAVGRAMNGGGQIIEESKPAVPPKKSIFPDYIVCLEDGKRFKSLKRHLRTKYNLSPEQYRDKWALPGDYPMVAPNYAKARSALAMQMGLGRKNTANALAAE